MVKEECIKEYNKIEGRYEILVGKENEDTRRSK